MAAEAGFACFPPHTCAATRSRVTAIDRGWLLLLVLEGGQAFLARAREALARGDMATFAQYSGAPRTYC